MPRKTYKNIWIGYITFKTKKQALSICHQLLQQKLIACANILPPHHSLYEWNGRMESTREVLAFIKTQQSLLKKVEQKIRDLHSYDTPCIVFWPIEAGADKFLSWVNNQTQNKGAPSGQKKSRKKNI